MAPLLQHVLYHHSKDSRYDHHVVTCCGLAWTDWDSPVFDESIPTCIQCLAWLPDITGLREHRVVRGQLVELHHDHRTP